MKRLIIFTISSLLILGAFSPAISGGRIQVYTIEDLYNMAETLMEVKNRSQEGSFSLKNPEDIERVVKGAEFRGYIACTIEELSLFEKLEKDQYASIKKGLEEQGIGLLSLRVTHLIAMRPISYYK